MIRLAIAVLAVSAAVSAAQISIVEWSGAYSLQDGRSRAVTVALHQREDSISFEWPVAEGKRNWDTALLRVQVDTDPLVASPFIEVTTGTASDRQYFSAGDMGTRWVNLSAVRGAIAGGESLWMRSSGVTIAGPSAELRLFSNQLDLSRPILVLAPHPDDAEIAAFGLYAHRRSTVVTVTAGNAGAATYESVFDDLGEMYLFKGRIRLIDSITIPWQGGVPPERAFNMGYFDARLAEMYDKRDAVVPEMYRDNADISVYRRENIGSLLPTRRSRASKWSHLVDDTVSVLRKVRPAIVVAPHPQLDTHRDHQFTSVALAEALERWRGRTTLLLYTNHADRNRYPYGPAGTLMSLPPVPRGVTVTLDRVYSHPVPPSLQRLKLFALESMHDLRFNPSRQYQLALGDERALAPEKPGPAPDISYLRRAPRSNELFYVYDRESFAGMVKLFLQSRPSPAGPSLTP